jgi:hypothetical protein
MYVENKSGQPAGQSGVRGPARIGRVKFSKTGKSLYYNGKTFRSLKATVSKLITTTWRAESTIGFPAQKEMAATVYMVQAWLRSVTTLAKNIGSSYENGLIGNMKRLPKLTLDMVRNAKGFVQ